MLSRASFLNLVLVLTLSISDIVTSASHARGLGLLPAAKIKESADEVLAMMSYSVVPDLTSSFLSIRDDQVGQNRFFMTQFAGGETISKSVPIYLEGSAAIMRFDPVFCHRTRTGLSHRSSSLEFDRFVGWRWLRLPRGSQSGTKAHF